MFCGPCPQNIQHPDLLRGYDPFEIMRDRMETNAVVCSQYFAALRMLRQAVERCPDSMWDAEEDVNKFWRVAYHALFFTHLYLEKSFEDFRPWSKHWSDAEALGKDAPAGRVFSRNEILEYADFCREQAEKNSALLDPSAPSGFDWCPFSKLELQFYNIRHIQQHTGEMMERLGSRADIHVDWVFKG